MKWFYNLKISVKLLTGFLVIALAAGVIGIMGILSINTIDNLDTELYEINTKPLGEIGRFSTIFHIIRVDIRELIIANDEISREKYLTAIDELAKEADKCLEEFDKSIRSDDVRKEYDNLKSYLSKYRQQRQQVAKLAVEGKKDEAIELMHGEGYTTSKAIEDSVDKLYGIKITQARQKSDNNTATARMTVNSMMAMILITLFIAVILGVLLARIISRPITKLVNVADKLALGDIKVDIKSTTKDEVGNLMASFASMVEGIREQTYAVEKIASGDLTVRVKVRSEDDLLGKKLNEMIETNCEVIGNINGASEQVASGADQISVLSETLSQSSTEQASAIEEISASMEQIAAQTKQNALSANEASEAAVAARNNAMHGNGRMNEMLKAMGEINDSSSNISKIIKVIDEIAFQTNILALNAAVEAARAGHHGKGFAVVAEEVRNLAARSANAAKETTDMIENSIAKVEMGTKIANETAESLTRIMNDTERATELVKGIAAASNEQAAAISQINQAVIQVSQVVQTNSSTSEESALASEELSSQASLLRSLVGKFKIRKYIDALDMGAGLNHDDTAMNERAVGKGSVGVNHVKSTIEGRYARKPRPRILLDAQEFGKY